MKRPIDPDGIAALLAARAVPGKPLLVGITGSVAVGKSTLASSLAAALATRLEVDQFASDGFLLPNAILDAQGLTLRKGFPETFDDVALARTLEALRTGPATVPGYSHQTYDVDPALARRVGPADIILIEGLGLAPHHSRSLDILVYIDAAEADIERWYVDRFMRFWHAAGEDPKSFYARFRQMSEPEAGAFANMIWQTINLPNLREHISRARPLADVVVYKAADHSLALVHSA